MNLPSQSTIGLIEALEAVTNSTAQAIKATEEFRLVYNRILDELPKPVSPFVGETWRKKNRIRRSK